MAHGQDGASPTLYIGNLPEEVDEDLLYELMLQAAPVVSIYLPRNRFTRQKQGFGFVEFSCDGDADYATHIMASIKLYGKQLKITRTGNNVNEPMGGARLFVGQLDPLVDEEVLSQIFVGFGPIATTKIVRDVNGVSRGHGFVIYENFEAADKALATMDGQNIMNRPCRIAYAYKESGGFHGDSVERLLASEAKKNHHHFAQHGRRKKRKFDERRPE